MNWKKESRLTGFEQSASTVYTFNNASNDVLVYKKHYYGENKNSLYIYDSVTNTSNFFHSTKNTDALKRISQKTFGAPASNGVNAEITYGYVTNGTKKTMMISSETAKTNNALTSERTYTYSDNGNIEQINITKPENDYLGSGMTVNTTKTVKYYYDEMNRLTKEENAVTGKTTEFQYDSSNNISKKIVNGTEYSYGYSNGLLTSFNGQSIVYTGGYPTNYRGTPFSWSRNRLESYTKSGTTYTFTYDAFGRKVKKQAGTNYWLYYYDGDKLIGQDRYTSAGLLYGARYIYDDEGLFGVKVRGGQSSQPNIYQNFYVTKDAYGNIVRMDGAQGKVLEIEYDAWGNQNVIYSASCGDTDVSAKEFMPFRYRGYYYDDNLGLYYLMSRYYDPETGRFISPDSIDYLDPETLGGLNLYSYCYNNPITNIDKIGNYPSPNYSITISQREVLASLINNQTYAFFFGNIELSRTVTLNATNKKNTLKNGLYTNFDYDALNKIGKITTGFNIENIFNIGVGISSNGSFFVSGQIGSFLNGGISAGLNGISISIGLNFGNLSYDLTATIGWGTLGLVSIAGVLIPYLIPILVPLGALLGI